ncbi:DUF378 domain-containing protein [Candidatus Kaiserbacteria bacterium]|nr:DUF378 domain-containing protein [Candidatus Kaiserbacteria bacterium]
MKSKSLHMLTFILLVIGGLNWGLIGIGGFAGSDWNVLHAIFGSWPTLEWIIYVLVGLSALLFATTHSKDCRICTGMM